MEEMVGGEMITISSGWVFGSMQAVEAALGKTIDVAHVTKTARSKRNIPSAQTDFPTKRSKNLELSAGSYSRQTPMKPRDCK